MFQIQIFHAESGIYMNTNHKSEDLEALKLLLSEPAFAGPRFRIVDQNGTVRYGPVAVEREAPFNMSDLANSLGVPVRSPRDFGPANDVLRNPTRSSKIGFTLQAIHEGDGKSIISLRLPEDQSREIIRELWAGMDFWAAPGGGSVRINTAAEAETINRVVGNCWISFAPERHRWIFHVDPV